MITEKSYLEAKKLIADYESEQLNKPVVSSSLLDEAIAAFDKLTNGERIIVMDGYCKGCGRKEDGGICGCVDF